MTIRGREFGYNFGTIIAGRDKMLTILWIGAFKDNFVSMNIVGPPSDLVFWENVYTQYNALWNRSRSGDGKRAECASWTIDNENLQVALKKNVGKIRDECLAKNLGSWRCDLKFGENTCICIDYSITFNHRISGLTCSVSEVLQKQVFPNICTKPSIETKRRADSQPRNRRLLPKELIWVSVRNWM